ncbi:hypothetical protein U6B65_12920 [Oscillospiraceae bacterium MB08-C2-2]|nr:hypothetical protein U6B65_12920 [Oscillospiraceae bacterium MB08-C2-2]
MKSLAYSFWMNMYMTARADKDTLKKAKEKQYITASEEKEILKTKREKSKLRKS